MFRKILPALLALSLALMACGIQINLPRSQPAGPLTTDEISLPLPADTTKTVDLNLTFGAGELKLHSGTDSLISGTASYNIADFKPKVTSTGSTVSIEQGNWRLTGIPDMSNIKNEWDLALGNVPLDLNIQAGAYKAEYEFGGLALKNLTIKDGASEVQLGFSSPNTAEMTLLRYETGASKVTLTGLANANFASMIFNSGAGNYTLNFTGDLKRSASVNITSGISNLILVIPQGIPVQVNVQGGLANVTFGTGWSKDGSSFIQEGTGPQLTFVVSIGAGNLTLTH